MFKFGKLLTGMATMAVLAGTVGCSPAVQPLAPDTITGKEPLVSGAWQAISNAVLHDESAGMYDMKMNSTVAEGAMHSSFAEYGSFNPPNRATFNLSANNVSEQYYQQGTSAYVQSVTGWSQTAAMTDIDVFPSFQSLVNRAAKANIPVRLLKKAYVLDEFCTVYAATIPASWLQPLPSWMQQVPTAVSPVEYIFYVGQKDGNLRQVSTTAVGSVTNGEPISMSTDTVFWAIGKSTAQVHFPPSLLATMEK